MPVDTAYHFPPDLLALLIDTIPVLVKSRPDVLLLFKSAGVEHELLIEYEEQLRLNPGDVRKRAIATGVLTRLNEGGDRFLGVRRNLLRRIVEWETLDSCWPADRLEAEGRLANIRRLVGVKDSFTRLDQERERERMARQEAELAARRARAERQTAIDSVKDSLFALFKETDPQRRGKALEPVLNRLFQVYGIKVRDAFTVAGGSGSDVSEQIDGAIQLDGDFYLVEMKWWNRPIGVPEISQHLVRVYNRSEARAIIISASEYTAPSVELCREALSQKVVVLCTLAEIVHLLEKGYDLIEFLREKVRVAILDRNPFHRVTY